MGLRNFDYLFTSQDFSLLLRQIGHDARFLTVLEPFRHAPAIRDVQASEPDRVELFFADGRTQIVDLDGLATGTSLRVILREYRNGILHREETTS